MRFALDEEDPNGWKRELDNLAEGVGGLLKGGRCAVEEDKVDPSDERREDERDGNDGAIGGIGGWGGDGFGLWMERRFRERVWSRLMEWRDYSAALRVIETSTS